METNTIQYVAMFIILFLFYSTFWSGFHFWHPTRHDGSNRPNPLYRFRYVFLVVYLLVLGTTLCSSLFIEYDNKGKSQVLMLSDDGKPEFGPNFCINECINVPNPFPLENYITVGGCNLKYHLDFNVDLGHLSELAANFDFTRLPEPMTYDESVMILRPRLQDEMKAVEAQIKTEFPALACRDLDTKKFASRIRALAEPRMQTFGYTLINEPTITHGF